MLEGGDGARIKLALSSLIERLAPPSENEK